MKLKSIALILMTVALPAMAEKVSVNTKGMSLILDVENGKPAQYLYFGTKLNPNDLQNLKVATDGRMDAYPAYGLNTPAEAALAMRHSDGNLSTALVATGCDVKNEGNASVTTVHLKDPVYNIKVDLKYRAYNDVDMIEAWTEILNGEKGTVTLTTFASAMLPIRRGDVWMSHLSGTWAAEGQLSHEKLQPGEFVIRNNDGTRNSHTDHAEVMFSLDGKGQENAGNVIGAALVYSGNYKLKTVTFVFGVVDDLLTKYPDIAYIKWDANMPIMNHGSQYLSAADQSHLYIAYHQGFAKVIDRIRAKYKDVVIQCCASGGGRANWGMLRGFDEFWVSDNTDAMQRIYMQYGTSYFFPAIAMASHISAVPNHTVFRTTSLKYRIDVAMSGRLGMEIQPKNMTDEEKALCRKAISEYKEIRPVVQFGDLYRLVSPYDNQSLSSIMYVSEAKDKAVFYWWKLANFYNVHLPRVKMAGLDENKMYKVKELDVIDNRPLDCEGKSYSGKYLMEHGLEMPYVHEVDWSKKNDWSSRVLYLEAE